MEPNRTEPNRYADDLAEVVRDACARLLFIDAWASAVDSGECPACGAIDADADSDLAEVVGLADALRNGDPCPECGREIPVARSGDDWVDVLADLDTPVEAVVEADRILAGLGDGDRVGPDWTRFHVDAWARAVLGLSGPLDFGVEGVDAHAERFGTLLGFQALGHGIGLGDDIPSDGRSIVGLAQVPPAWGVQRWDGSTYAVESTHDSREAALDALRATRYASPSHPDSMFGAHDFDGGALLACSPGCEGVVAGAEGVETCDDCGRGLDDDGAAVRFGRLLAGRGRLGEAFGLLDGGRVVDRGTLDGVLDLLGRAAEVVRTCDRVADGAPAPFEAFDDWAADLLADAPALLARLGAPGPGDVVRFRPTAEAVRAQVGADVSARVLGPVPPSEVDDEVGPMLRLEVGEAWDGPGEVVDAFLDEVEAERSRPLGRVLAPEQAEVLRAGGAILTRAEVEAVLGLLGDRGDLAPDDEVARGLLDRLEHGRTYPTGAPVRRAESVAVRAVRARLWHWAQGQEAPTPEACAEAVRALDGEVAALRALGRTLGESC